ncbi:MAG: hypothetical protein NTY33_02550 [Candidatus Moranbacteria bacterium]|nr:hypothetical protein [Candidatus Moranbacteria bacterium]
MSIDNQDEYKIGMTELPKKLVEKEQSVFLKILSDPQYGQIFKEEQLKYKEEEVGREATGKVDFNVIPTQEIHKRAKERFVKEFSQQATKYPETKLLAEKQNLSENKQQLDQSIEKDTANLKSALKKLDIPENVANKAPSILMAKASSERMDKKLAKTEEALRQEEKQGELMGSFLEREYGAKKDSHIEKAKEELPEKGVAEFLADKPEDKNNELKSEIGEKIEKANQEGRPLEKDQEEALRKKAVGGLSQESTEQKETESSVLDDMEQPSVGELKNEDRESGGENSEQKSAGVALEKIRMHEFSGYTKDLVNTLRRREDDNLSPIIDPKAIGYLAQTADQLEDLFRNKKAKPEDVNQAILKVVAVINAIGKDLPRTGMVRDNSESLRRVAYNLRNLGESSRNIMIQLGGKEDPNLKETVGRFGQLLNLTEERWGYVNRKVGILENR